MLLAGSQVERPSSVIVLRVRVDRAVVQEVFNRPYVASGRGCNNLGTIIDAST